MLIVDDNAVNRRILHTQLTRWHTRPTAVGSGREALDALSAAAKAGRPFVLVLLDVNMPDLDGFQVAEQIAARPGAGRGDDHDAELVGPSRRNVAMPRAGRLGLSHETDPGIGSARRDLPGAQPHLEGAAGRAEREDGPPERRRARCECSWPEDNVVNQRVAVGLLTKRGHDVTVANNGLEALAALERGAFDVVLMDVQMPEMGGLEATAAIRQRERDTGGHMRIVAMTAHAMNGDRERCLAAGMDGYLSKPIDPAMLYATLEHEAAPTRRPARRRGRPAAVRHGGRPRSA